MKSTLKRWLESPWKLPSEKRKDVEIYLSGESPWKCLLPTDDVNTWVCILVVTISPKMSGNVTSSLLNCIHFTARTSFSSSPVSWQVDYASININHSIWKKQYLERSRKSAVSRSMCNDRLHRTGPNYPAGESTIKENLATVQQTATNLFIFSYFYLD